MAHAARAGWGYKLDYDKEIANDAKEIAETERHIPLARVLTEAERAWGPYHLLLLHFLFADVSGRAPLLGLSPEDVADLWWFSNMNPGECEYDAPEPRAGWYSRGEAVGKRMSEHFGSEYVIRDPQEMLTKLRSRLARHRRNKGKFG